VEQARLGRNNLHLGSPECFKWGFCNVAGFYKKYCAMLGLPSALALHPDVVAVSQRVERWGVHVTGGWWHSHPGCPQKWLRGQPAQTGGEWASEPGLRWEGREGRAALLGLATEAGLAGAATDAGASSFVFQRL